MKNKNRECVCVRKMLDAFADSELPAGERSRVAVHLGRCAVCAEELRGIRALLGILAAMPRIVPVGDLVPKIEQAACTAGVPAVHSAATSAGAPLAVRRWDLPNVLYMPSLKYAAYVSAAAVFMLGFWTSWEASDRFMTLFRTTRTKSVLVPADCYVARSTVMREAISEFHDGEGSSSLTEAMGLRTDEDGLYAVEM